MRVLLADLFLARNRGDYLIAMGTVEMLRRAYEGVEISGMVMWREDSFEFLQLDTRPYLQLLGHVEANPVGILQSSAESAAQNTLGRISVIARRMGRAGTALLRARLSIPSEFPGNDASWAHMRDFGLVALVGGGYLEATSLKDYPLLLSHLYPVLLAQLAGVPHAFVGESISGTDQVWARWLLRSAFSHASLVVFREHLSLAETQTNRLLKTPGTRVAVLPDLALALTESLRKSRRPRSKHSPITVGVAFRTWTGSRINPLRGDPVKTVAHALARAAQQIPMRFILIPFSRGAASVTDDDLPSCQALERELRRLDSQLEVSLATIPPPEDINGLARAFEGLDFAVSVRMHAALFAAMLGIPSVTVDYRGHKAQGVSEYLGLQEYNLRELSADGLERKVVQLARAYDRISVEVIDEVERCYRRLVDELVPLLKEIVS